MTHTRKRQNLKTKRRNPKSRATKRHKKKTNRRKRGGDINPCDTSILSIIKNADIEAYSEHLCNERKSLEQLENTLSTKTHNTCKDFFKSPEPESNCNRDSTDTCKNINACIDDAYTTYNQQEQRLHDLINTKMKKIEKDMFTLLEENAFDFNNTSVQDYLYTQIDDLTSINLLNEEFAFDKNSPNGKSGKNKSCNENEYCVVSQKIFLTIVISHLRFYEYHNLDTEKQTLLKMITTNADAIKKIIQYHMNDKSLKKGLEYIEQKIPEVKQ